MVPCARMPSSVASIARWKSTTTIFDSPPAAGALAGGARERGERQGRDDTRRRAQGELHVLPISRAPAVEVKQRARALI